MPRSSMPALLHAAAMAGALLVLALHTACATRHPQHCHATGPHTRHDLPMAASDAHGRQLEGDQGTCMYLYVVAHLVRAHGRDHDADRVGVAEADGVGLCNVSNATNTSA